VTIPSDTLARHSTRELAAIMFSDIVGYTAIMGRDEQRAMRALAAHRELLRSILPRFNGRLIGEIGDGTLSSFHSAVDAVNCAREIQASLNSDSELRIRIGIHVGDVVFTEKTVLGDGVNGRSWRSGGRIAGGQTPVAHPEACAATCAVPDLMGSAGAWGLHPFGVTQTPEQNGCDTKAFHLAVLPPRPGEAQVSPAL
jgi:Adenylate and Guanylate cyclase catalytic domain